MTDSVVFESDFLGTSLSNTGGQIKIHLNLRGSKTITSVEYRNKSVEFEFSNNVVTIPDLTHTDNTVGTITFDDGAVLMYIPL